MRLVFFFLVALAGYSEACRAGRTTTEEPTTTTTECVETTPIPTTPEEPKLTTEEPTTTTEKPTTTEEPTTVTEKRTTTTEEPTTTPVPTTTEKPTTTTQYIPTTPPPPIDECYRNATPIKAIIFLVDGSTSMGNGMFDFSNSTDGSLTNMSNVWDVYNQWQYVKGLINSFYVVVKPEFYTVVMKQYSSEDYIERECCRFCAPDMTRVLKQGEWDEDDWSAAADFTYTNITNCDTHTYGALIQTVDKWDEKRAELNLDPEDSALLILITDGEPNDIDEKRIDEAKAKLAASTVDLFIVYPNMTISEGSTQDNKLTRLKEMTAPDNSITYNFATDKVDHNLRDRIVKKLCENQDQQRTLRRLAQQQLEGL